MIPIRIFLEGREWFSVVADSCHMTRESRSAKITHVQIRPNDSSASGSSIKFRNSLRAGTILVAMPADFLL
jgi:hypothetical protein